MANPGFAAYDNENPRVYGIFSNTVDHDERSPWVAKAGLLWHTFRIHKNAFVALGEGVNRCMRRVERLRLHLKVEKKNRAAYLRFVPELL